MTLRWQLAALGVVSLALGTQCSSAQSSNPVTTPVGERCDARSLGSALMIQESALKKEVRDVESESAEGGVLTTWSDSSGPRLVRRTDFGETGRSETSIYLVDSLTFVALRSEYVYSLPLSQSPEGRVASARTSIRVFCGGVPMGDTGIDSATAMVTVRRALRGSL